MCGILGVWSPRHGTSERLVGALLDALRHRGPDDSGSWQDVSTGVLLAQTRLAVLDVSPTGHQPMHSASGRFVIVFNGEIYNHRSLRSELGTNRWRGSSDTETLLAAIEQWGLSGAIQRCTGMFALALWDRERETLHLARDRMGEKPLYFGMIGGALAFASELKVFRLLPGFEARVNRGALALFMRHSAVPAPHCIYDGLRKLGPGEVLSITAAALARGELPAPQAYWSTMDCVLDASTHPLSFANDAEAVTALEEELSRAVSGQMVADVPLGAFLSGGIDSSTIVALMQAQARRTGADAVRTFSVGFWESAYDESTHARAVAAHLGTDHTEVVLAPADVLAVIPQLPSIYDEPFADSSQIATRLVCATARQHVTVALSGDGGDELFGGYNRHILARAAWPHAAGIPLGMRRALATGIRHVSPARWDQLLQAASPLLPPRFRFAQPGLKLHRAANVLHSTDGMALYRGLVSHWVGEDPVVDAPSTGTMLDAPPPALPTVAELMMALDACTYLPDDILVKVDRAAMSVSLETRVPFLDHRVFEFAWRLPLDLKIRNGIGKWILRQVLYRHVPAALIERPKMGFGVPIDAWLRGPLKEWAEELLDERRLRDDGFFRPAPIRRRWAQHIAGTHDWQHDLWDVLMFQSWWADARVSPHAGSVT